MNFGLCEKVKSVLNSGPMSFDQLCVALPELGKQQISGALCNLWASGWLLRNGSTKSRIYEKRAGATPAIKKPRDPNIVPPRYQPSVFIGELGKSPTVFKPLTWQEREALCVGTR